MLEELKPLQQLITAVCAEEECWCMLTSRGSVVHSSQGFAQLYKDAPPVSLFEFNPEFSFLKWKDLVEDLKDKSLTLSTKRLLNKGSIEACQVSLIQFNWKDNIYILYKILQENKSTSVEIDHRDTSRALVESKHEYNYDECAPNPVMYFDAKGKIMYQNKRMQLLSDGGKRFDNISQVFLESEFGDVVKGIQERQEQEAEIIARMIMKSSRGMLEGYSRMSYHPQNQAHRYRLEFLKSDGMQLIDSPLEKAMIQLDRLKGEVSLTKSTLIDENIENFTFNSIVTKSNNYKAVLQQVAMVADTDTTVLIVGETGTGKELLSNSIYTLSDRSDELYVKVNCATIPKELFESTLFGHEKGSFTGADKLKIGKFELANNGTIFLDEIGELPIDLQAKLLRVLQEGEIERIGNAMPIKINVRIIAATNRDLKKMVKEKKFREDLYYRLNVFPIYNLPLRERKDDIPLLINYFLNSMNKKLGREVSSLKDKDLNMLMQYDYPGNVRELENIIERSVVISKGEVADLSFLSTTNVDFNENNTIFRSLDDTIKSHIEQALQLAKGKVTGKESASEFLNLKGKTLASKLSKYNIDPNRYRS